MRQDFDWNMMPCGVAYCRVEPDSTKNTGCILEDCNRAFSVLVSGDDVIQDLSGHNVMEFIAEEKK